MSALYWENFRPNVFLSIEYPNCPFSLVCIELRKKRTEMFRSTSKSIKENFYNIPLRSQIYYTTFLSDLLHSQIGNNAYYSHPFREINMIIHESGDNNKNYLPGT